jgi:hypothetical protein
MTRLLLILVAQNVSGERIGGMVGLWDLSMINSFSPVTR